ncbi:hypothetical protein BpHYR1_007589 [Brachionus plicatilis]|uniref:Uncharacterized protein n=1 Tax=Brachionus plicatilis TaxID=10195 RepID=A0A3M7R288_BRAPC|nr:hypothetical protein BpHYR1_007589 [Brachionus plicatilis]
MDDPTSTVDISVVGQNSSLHMANADFNDFLAAASVMLGHYRQPGVRHHSGTMVVQVVVEQNLVRHSVRLEQLIEQKCVVVQLFSVIELAHG